MTPEILIVGAGPGPVSLLTREAEQVLLAADRTIFRMTGHPVCHWLRERDRPVVPLDFVYKISRITYDQVYEFIADIVVREAKQRGRAVYVLPGHPCVFEATPALIRQRADALGISVRIIPGLSFLELAYAELGIDPVAGLQIVSAFDFQSPELPVTSRLGLLIGQTFTPVEPQQSSSSTQNIQFVDRWLKEHYPLDHAVSLVWTTGMPEYETHSRTFALADLVSEIESLKNSAWFGTMFVPALGATR